MCQECQNVHVCQMCNILQKRQLWKILQNPHPPESSSPDSGYLSRPPRLLPLTLAFYHRRYHQHLHEHRHQGYLNLMMKVTPLAPWSSISFFKDEMLLRRCFPIKVSGYLKCTNHNSYKTGLLLLFPRHRIIR